MSSFWKTETGLSDTFFVDMVTCENLQEFENAGCEQPPVNAQCQEDAVKNDKWVAPLQINWALVTLKLDTGAKANLISMSDIKKMTEKVHNINSSNHVLFKSLVK